MHLEISAFSCSRLLRTPGADLKLLRRAARALLAPGGQRQQRFVARGLLNFFVALERLLGAPQVELLAQGLAQRLAAEDLEGCSAGDKYRGEPRRGLKKALKGLQRAPKAGVWQSFQVQRSVCCVRRGDVGLRRPLGWLFGPEIEV